MKRVVLNFLPLKTGGGVQVAMDFLSNIPIHGQGYEWHLVCRQGASFRGIADPFLTTVTEIRDRTFSRGFFEYFSSRKYVLTVQPDVIYTQFGPQWPINGVPQVAGCAYSNLFYPELGFWKKLPYLQRLKKGLIDYYRLKRFLDADVRVLESEDLQSRAISQFGLNEAVVRVVRPAVSKFVSNSEGHEETKRACEKIPPGFRVALLSGYHPNKNIEVLVDAAFEIVRTHKVEDVIFVVTLPQDHPGTQRIHKQAQRLGVEKNIFNLGPVPQEGCVEVYRAADASVLPSTLESFSNMIAESWGTDTPLIVSDLPWAHALCGTGAQYFRHVDSRSLAESVLRLKNSKSLCESLVRNGRRELSRYPTSGERFLQYLEIIESASAMRPGNGP